MKLIIVESPTKAFTIQKFLKGKDYIVRSSYGHVRDLPEDELGVEIENNFQPKYLILPKAKKRIFELKKYLKEAQKCILATDEDREGESIAWHLLKVLNIEDPEKYERIVFHEITKRTIEEALKNPRKIDLNLVNAQQGRRILDRLVGYKLSPFLWEKVKSGLSAGRVQSVAVRLVVEREKEIENFIPQEYWTIEALLRKIRNPKFEIRNKSQTGFKALLVKKNGKVIPKLGIKNKEEAEKIIKDLKGAEYKVINVEKKEIKRSPLPPFTTSTLQQTAWQRFKWPAKFTMKVAQELYEKGLTTYHRTDSLNISDLALGVAKKFIIQNYGKNYYQFRKYKAKGKVQEAHEAIRPTYPEKIPEKLKIQKKLDDREIRLYDLIWRRFIACQMAQACFDSTIVEVEANPKFQMGPSRRPEGRRAGWSPNSKQTQNKYTFRARGQVLRFDGFLKVYPIKYEENELPPLEPNEALELIKLIPSQHFTQPPPRYTDATLIKELEKNGIGRPSTYAPIISTIQERNYVKKDEKRRFFPTEIGEVVNDLLVNHFPEIVDLGFTAKMEENLDKIASGEKEWVPVIKEFYEPFEKKLQKKYQEVSKETLIKKTDKNCPECGASFLIKFGKFGRFYACSNFPKCKYTEPLEENKLKVNCPKCGAVLIEKRTKKGKIFYACSNWPNCDFALWDRPNGEKCPKCGFLLVETKRLRSTRHLSTRSELLQVKCSNKKCNFRK